MHGADAVACVLLAIALWFCRRAASHPRSGDQYYGRRYRNRIVFRSGCCLWCIVRVSFSVP